MLVLRNTPQTRSPDGPIARSYESTAADVTREDLAGKLFDRLAEANLLPKDATFDGPLPANIAALIAAEPELVERHVETYGELLAALITDSDEDQLLDLDALELQRFLPGAHQQQIFHALAPAPKGDFSAPADFGLAGASELDRWRQQIMLRGGGVLVDSGDEDGVLDPDDQVEVVDRTSGKIATFRVGELREELTRTINYNLATARAAETYDARAAAGPATFSMRFIGDSGDAVNPDFWKLSTALGGRPSWELQPNTSPAAAIDDCFGPHASLYATECAHARTLLRLKGMLDFDRSTLRSREAGDYRFSARFAADAEQAARAEAYLASWKESGDDWEDFVEDQPPPGIAYALEISRHRILDGAEDPVLPFFAFPSGPAAGDSGYFRNNGVSVSGVRNGWVGENVIDLGYKNGVHRWYGHPVGIQTEEQWKATLAEHDVTKMTQFIDYVRPKLPAATSIVQAFRAAVGDHMQSGGSNALRSFFASPPAKISRIADLAPLTNHLTPDGISSLAGRLNFVDRDVRDRAMETLGIEAEEPEDRAALALYIALVPDGETIDRARIAEGALLVDRLAIMEELRPGGKLASRDDLRAWLKSEEFPDWYREHTGREWTKPVQLERLSVADVEELVLEMIPQLRGVPTIYAVTNGGDAKLATQMAELLRRGKLAEPTFAPETPLTPR